MLPTLSNKFSISFLCFTLKVKPWTDTSKGCHHQIQRLATSEAVARAQTLSMLDKVVIQKITTVDPTVASTGIFLLFPSFFTCTRMPVTLSQPTSQGAGGLHMALPPHIHQPPRPPGPAIRTLNIRYGRGCGLSQDILEEERGGLDIMYLKETIQREELSNNQRDYGVS